MPVQSFYASASWDWPDDISRVEVRLIGGGAGSGVSSSGTGEGGGAGGNYASHEIWRGAESGLEVTIGAGGARGEDGGDTFVEQGANVVCLAAGGKTSADGHAGGLAGDLADNVPAGLGGTGGAGGDGSDPAGGGGGAGANQYGSGGGGGFGGFGDPPSGGLPALPATDRGRGGAGASFAHVAGQDGHFPGGGGGGGAVNHVDPFTAEPGGVGAAGYAVFIWGGHSGVTLFSSGCCCGFCDLTQGAFPATVNITASFTPRSHPGFFEDPHVVFHSSDMFECDGPGSHDSTEVEHQHNAIDNSLVGSWTLLDRTLELVDFQGGYDPDSGGSQICKAIYQAPLLGPEWDARLGGAGHRAFITEWPGGGLFQYSSTLPSSCEGGGCDNLVIETFWTWKKFGPNFLGPTLTLTIRRDAASGDYSYAASFTMSLGGGFGVNDNSSCNSDSQSRSDTAYEGLDDSRMSYGLGSQVYAKEWSGGPFETGELALAAAKADISTADTFAIEPIQGEWTELADTTDIQTSGGSVCDPCPPIGHSYSQTVTWQDGTDHWYSTAEANLALSFL